MALIVQIEVLQPLPPGLKRSYGTLEYANYGVFTWKYTGGWFGEPEFVNFPKFQTRSKMQDPVGYLFHPSPGLLYNLTPLPDLIPDIGDIAVNSVITNLLKSKTVPFF
jgi:hypothetical protein